MGPKRENGQAANRRLTRLHYFIYHHYIMHVHAGATRKLMCVYSHVRATILSLRPVS